jgi:hypothetical protein
MNRILNIALAVAGICTAGIAFKKSIESFSNVIKK